MRTHSLIAVLTGGSLLSLAAVQACGGNPETTSGGSGGFGTGASDGGGAAGQSGSSGGGQGGEGAILNLPDASDAGGDVCVGDVCEEPEPACGDGSLDPEIGEVCDDGNSEPGDGCATNCDAIEKDWACPTPGMPCVFLVECGDGQISGEETCDDQNDDPGDGCSAVCQVEPGWKCEVVGAACTAAECGDGIIAGDEQCEDDDDVPADADGCSATCRLEDGFACDGPGQACRATVCGDGVAEGSEQCDDMNNDLGDGCTPFCVKEPDCSGSSCKSECGDGLKLPNDDEECEDGNTQDGDGCSADCKIEDGFMCTDVTSTSTELVLPLVLRDFSSGHPDFETCVNGVEPNIVALNLGADGKPVFNGGGATCVTNQANFDQWYRDVPGTNHTFVRTMTLTQLPGGEFQFNDSSFFPLNGDGFGNQGNTNNFHFTSEVRYWFEFKGGEQLDFTGDDDVWVFVNKQRAVDLGGVHGAANGSVTLTAGSFGMVLGEVYEIVVFQAERHTSESNYRLTLSDFDNTLSQCESVCGDGVKTPDEVCDDGINDGAYGNCTADCQFGPRCGDGILQPDEEECDEPPNLSPYGDGCAPGCKKGGFCGDGVVDSLFGEQCDDGVNDGGYGECDEGCVNGPFCGDGVLQPAEEQCDDGNRSNGDGCSAACTREGPK